jgi:predicted P-loop ATPase
MTSKTSAPKFEEVLKLKHLFAQPLNIIPLLVDSKLPAVSWKRAIDGQPFGDDELRDIWGRFGGKVNPGIACGRFSAGGLMVVDLDTPEAVEWATENLPPTPMKTVTRHGEHWYYRLDDGYEKMPNRADVLGEKQKWAWRAETELGLDVHLRQARAQSEGQLKEETERAAAARKEAEEKLGIGAVIDVRGDGGQVVAPGAIHPSGFVYREKTPWADIDVADLPAYDPAWFDGRKWQRPGKKGPVSMTALKSKRRERALESAINDTTYEQQQKRGSAWLTEVDPSVAGHGGHNKTFYAACRLVCGFLIRPEDAFEMLRTQYNPTCQPPWSDEELAHKVTEAEKQMGQNDGYMLVDRPEFTARRKVRERAVFEPSAEDFEDHESVTDEPVAAKGAGGGVPPPPSSPPSAGPPPPPRQNVPGLTDDEKEWQKRWAALGVDYARDLRKQPGRPEQKWKRDKPKGVWQIPPETINLAIVLKHSRFFGYDLRYNELKLYEELNGKRLTDRLVLSVKFNLDYLFQKDIALEKVRNALEGAASENVHEPVQEWLMGLPAWDGVDRIAQAPTELMGMEKVEEVHKTMFRHFMTGLAARILKPGVKMDTIMFLVGSQGAGKSQFFRLLTDGHLDGDQWFTDAPISLRDKDGRMLIGTNVVVEWSEGEHAKSSKMIDNVKQFLSQQEDEFRPPYGRNNIKRPRRCVFCGTSNDMELLHDSTGSRRFYILETGKALDLAKVVDWREQLFAQALAIYQLHMASKPGSPDWDRTRWWFTAAEDKVRVKAVTKFRAQSAWYEDVSEWLDARISEHGRDWKFRIGDVISGALDMDKDKKSKRVETEIRQVLVQLGCQAPTGRSYHQGLQALWWTPPKDAQDDLPF